jgi:hypothetical protein
MATITLAIQRPVGVVPSGAMDGVNREFLLPAPVHAAQASVYHNGLRLAPPDDFVWTESGSPGSGYDTILFDIEGTPRPGDSILVDY